MMRIETAESQTCFKPTEAIRGTAVWSLEAAPKRLELRLFWYTQGKGDQDVEVVERMPFEGSAGREHFSFVLPEEPYSFSGKLISLVWALELVAEEPDETCRVEFTLSPSREEIRLGM